MNIAQLQGEKTVSALATRLLAQPTKDTPKTTQSEMEAALLRLNPHLNQIGSLNTGTPIVVPDNFGLAGDQSVAAMRGLAAEILQQAETALTSLRATLQEHAAQATEQTDQVQEFLKGDQAQELVKSSPDLKAIFSNATTAVKALPKEQAAAIAAQQKALDKVHSQLATFRVK
jgi:hypothetical protein